MANDPISYARTTQVRLRRGTTAQIAANPPIEAEPFYDLTEKRIGVGGTTEIIEQWKSQFLEHTADATDAVPVNLQEKLTTEMLSVKDFGASPNATGAQNVAAFKRAFSAVSGGGFLLIPAGVYELDGNSLGGYNSDIGSSIDIEGSSNVTILGYGATIKMTNANAKVWFRFRSCRNIVFKGPEFIGHQTGNGGSTSSGVCIYFDTSAENITIEDISGRFGYGLIEFQTDGLIPMSGAKYENVTIRNIRTHAYYHALELLHINRLTTDNIVMTGTGSGNEISFRGIYALNVTNWNGSNIIADGCGDPSVGGYPVFIREYTPGVSATLADFNCDTINLKNLAIVNCFAGGIEANVAAGQIKNLNLSNVILSAKSTNNYGGGLLEFAHDDSNPTGINNVKISNLQITGADAAGLACILYRNSSNVATDNTAFSLHFFENIQIDAKLSAPLTISGGGWIEKLKITDIRTSTTNTTPFITFDRVRDGFLSNWDGFGKIDFSGNKLVRVEFENANFSQIVNNSVGMAPIIFNGDSLTTATIYVDSSGGDNDGIGSSSSPLSSLVEAINRIGRLRRGDTKVSINLANNANHGAFALKNISSPIELRMPLGATLTSIDIRNCKMVDIRNGTTCTAGAYVENSGAFLQSITFPVNGSTPGISAVRSRITSSNNVFATDVGIKAVAQSIVWSKVDTGTCVNYGYALGEASTCYKETSSTLTGSTAQKQTLSVHLANF